MRRLLRGASLSGRRARKESQYDKAQHQRKILRCRPSGRYPAAVDASRSVGPYRNQVRLRHGAVRRVYRACRWQTGTRVHDAHFRAGEQEGHHDRSDWQQQGGKGGAGRVDRPRRTPVWLLPGGPDHVRDRAAQAETQAHRCRHRRGDDGKHLPLRYLHAHSCRHQAGGRTAGSESMNAPIEHVRSASDDTSSDGTLVLANVSRRRFLRDVSALGGLVLAAGFPVAARGADAPKYGADGMPHGWVDNPLVFVAIGEDGIVSIVCHRSEMGQGVRTGMPMIVADELEADWKRVRVVQANGDETRFGNQDTDGSRSTRHFLEPMRRCGAAARQMLEAAAAARWNVPVAEVEGKNHEVIHRPSGRRVGYGALAKDAAKLPVPPRETLRLKDPSRFRYIGKGQLKLVDGPNIASGKAQYGIDTRLPGMLYAVVARPPVYGGKVAKYDAAQALKVPGVVRVVEIEGSPPPAEFNPLGGVAVIGRNTWAAIKGREALKIEWADGPNR